VFDRFSSISKVLITSCLGVFVFIVSACGAPLPVGASPQVIPTCPPTSTNPYRLHQPPNQVTNIFSSYKNNPIIYDNVRQDAFIQLGNHIKQWSDYKDVTIDGRTVRIMITYLDPMLVQYIVLNDALVPPNNSLSQGWFEDQIRAAMASLEKRNEIMFIIIITSQFDGSALFVDFPIKSLEFVSSSGRRVPFTHYDSILDENNDVSQRPVFGYIGYPISLALSGSCIDVVDQWTTSLKLEFNLSQAQDNPFYSLFWNIPYPALVVLQGNSRPVPTIDPFINTDRYKKSDNLPPPNTLINDERNANFYWEEMARYIWSKVIMMENQ
jgi:hypothetical protein